MDETREALVNSVRRIARLAAMQNPVGVELAARQFRTALRQHERAVMQEFTEILREEIRSER